MKILVISTQIFPSPPPTYGGLELVTYNLAECFGMMGHDVYLLAPDGSKGEHFKVITPCKPALYNPEEIAYESIKPALRDFDVISDHSWVGHVYLAKKEWPKLQVQHTMHGPLPFTTKPVEKPCLVAASQAHATYLKKAADFDCQVIRHGIDVSRHPYGQEQREDFLLYLARIAEEKGALEFIDLCRKTGMKGIMAGEDTFISSPGYVRKVVTECEKAGIRYLGPIGHDYKVELLQRARCLVSPLLPPYIEVFGLATLEAMACGTPVLSTDRGAAKELIVHGVTGAVARDVDCLEENLQVALNCKPEDCRARAEEFPREKMAKGYLELFQRMIDGYSW